MRQAGASIGNPNFQATDPDASSTITYSTTCTEVTIDSSTGAASFTSAYDMDVAGTTGSITCPITVSDGALTDTATLTVTVNNINDNTPTFGQASYTFTTANTAAVGTTLGSVAATDGDLSTSSFGSIISSIFTIKVHNHAKKQIIISYIEDSIYLKYFS